MNKPLTFKFNKPIKLYCITDAHIGHKQHDKEKFDAVIKRIEQDKDAYCFFNGDNIEFTPGGYHGAENEQILSIDDQVMAFTDLLKRLKKKVLFFRIGNHERRAAHLIGLSLDKHLGRELGIPRLSEGYEQTHFQIKGKTWTLATSHGEGGGTTKVMQNVVRAFKGKPDVYFLGHSHEFRNLNEGFGALDYENDLVDDSLMLVGGSFLKFAEYAHRLNKRPTQTGCYVLNISEEGISILEKIV